MTVMSPYAGKRLLVFQSRPFPPASGLDGSEAVLLDLLRHFSTIGVRVTVYCTRRPDGREELELFPKVVVRAVLRFGADYPNIYDASPSALVDVIRVLQSAAEEHDALYIHDSNLRFTGIGADRPVIAAAFDLVYGHTLAGVLSFTGDRLIAISDYLGQCLDQLFRQFDPARAEALQVINTGFADQQFGPRDARSMRQRLRLAPDAIPVLCPHRLDPAKGFYEAVSALELLRKRLRPDVYRRVRLLIPMRTPPGESTDPSDRRPDILRYADDLGAAEQVHCHAWISRRDMAEYYSLGVATLCVGTFVEAFGNVHVESTLCGTPAIVSRVGAQRTTVPEGLSRKVDPGDADSIAEHLAEIIGREERAGDDVHAYLREKFDAQRMFDDYGRVLLGTGKRPASGERNGPRNRPRRRGLASHRGRPG